MKELLTQAPILRLSDFSKPFIVQTDAADTGVGAALLQDFDDSRFSVAYASKKLLPRERNYSVTEREVSSYCIRRAKVPEISVWD